MHVEGGTRDEYKLFSDLVNILHYNGDGGWGGGVFWFYVKIIISLISHINFLI